MTSDLALTPAVKNSGCFNNSATTLGFILLDPLFIRILLIYTADFHISLVSFGFQHHKGCGLLCDR